MSTDKLTHYQNFNALFTRLQQARSRASGKTLAQDLVRTFMLGISSIYPCTSVRVFFGGWHYEHFTDKRIKLPALAIESNQRSSQVFRNQQEFIYTNGKSKDDSAAGLEEYIKQGINQIQMIPFSDVNQLPLGFVEITSNETNIPPIQQELLRLLIRQLATLLETSQQSVRKPKLEQRKTPPELLGRLQGYEEENQKLAEKLQENIKQARDRETVFYSLIRYFRDTVKMIDAWNHLKSLTPEGKLAEYDFQQHTEHYVQQAFKFSELLLYIYKLQQQEIQMQYMTHEFVPLIYSGIEQFTKNHNDTALELKTNFPAAPVHPQLDSFLFRTAVVYALEHLFLMTSRQKHAVPIVIDAYSTDEMVQLVLRIEPDPLMKTLSPQEFDFSSFMHEPLDDYGLSTLFLPFVNLAITSQGGICKVMEGGDNLICITIQLPMNPPAVSS